MADPLSTSTTAASVPEDGASRAESATETFAHDWYVRIKVEFQDPAASSPAAEITDIDQEVASLHTSLQTQLELPDVQLLPQRFMDEPGQKTKKSCIRFWLIGLPTMASTEIAEARKIVRAWEATSGEGETAKGTTVQAKFLKREIILQQNLTPDILLETPPASVAEQRQAERRTGDSFKKIKGSSPSQIRRQFLHHAMGGEVSTPNKSAKASSGLKLRPPKDVFDRMKFDSAYDVEEYVVGYIDRRAGILEKPVVEWRDYGEDELIAYFRHVPSNEIVWDRAGRVDRVFDKR